jgi:hypothetical protein
MFLSPIFQRSFVHLKIGDDLAFEIITVVVFHMVILIATFFGDIARNWRKRTTCCPPHPSLPIWLQFIRIFFLQQQGQLLAIPECGGYRPPPQILK